MRTRPRIYVASLADYNAGRLLGDWIDADQKPESIQVEIDGILSESEEPVAEDWAIHDYENFGGITLSEYESLETVTDIAQAITEFGEPFTVWAAENFSGNITPADIASFPNYYSGTCQNFREFADEIAESALLDLGIDSDHIAYRYFDWDAFSDELKHDFYGVQTNWEVCHIFTLS